MTNRITGTNSGIDVDSVVKQSLTTEQSKIDKAYQQQKVYEYQQEQLKSIVSDVQDFYDKYLDILSGDSLLRSTAFETASFTTTDLNGLTSNAVTAKGFAGADVTDYTVTVTQLASKATASIYKNSIKIGDEIEIKVGDGDPIKIKIYEKSDGSYGADLEKAAKDLNIELKKNGINVNAKYSQIAGGIVLESGNIGKEASFKVKLSGDNDFTEYKGKNAEGTIKKGNYIVEINEASNTFIKDNIQFTLNAITAPKEESTKESDKLTALKESDSGVTTTITSDKKTTIISGNTTIITSGNTVTELETKEGVIINTITTIRTDDITLEINDKNEPKVLSGYLTADFSAKTYPSTYNGITTTKDNNGVFIATKDLGNGITISTTFTPKEGKEGEYDKENKVIVGTDFKPLSAHTDEEKKKATISIESENGRKNTIITADGKRVTTELKDDGSIKEMEEALKIDGSDYDFIKTTTYSGSVTLSGETNISNLKDTIVKFVNDYNKLIQTINDKLWETRDKDYMPLTEEQKKAMSESEIEAWEKKAQTGLLRNDSDLKRIQNAMKSAMSSMMSSTGLTLESIGIEPVENYTTKNGLYKIDESKLTKALQNNSEDVKDLFTRSVGTEKDSNGNVIDKGGVLTQLQSVLKSEFKTSTSSLSKRIGFEGTSTESSNTLSKNILKQKSLIAQLKEKYSDKETALYKKYSNLEVMLEKLNSQTNSLYSMLGISS